MTKAYFIRLALFVISVGVILFAFIKVSETTGVFLMAIFAFANLAFLVIETKQRHKKEDKVMEEFRADRLKSNNLEER